MSSDALDMVKRVKELPKVAEMGLVAGLEECLEVGLRK